MSYYGGQGQQYGGGGYGGGSQGPPGPPPQVPRPWYAEWDARDGRWIYINEQNGERTFEHPQQRGYGGGTSAGYDGGYGGGQYGGPGPANYGGASNPSHTEEHSKQKGGHGLLYGALGAAAGLAGGAFLMHEGHEAKQDYEEDKYRVDRWEDREENRIDNFGNRIGNDIVDAPENVANWTGRKVGEVEDIPQDIEGGFDRFGERVERRWDDGVQDVEDAPERLAGWAGDKVGDVERFGDNVDGAYDAGRDEGRYGDDDRW